MRCIDADAFRDRLQNLGYDDWNQGTTTTWAEAFSECADMVEEMPTIEPRKKGRWIYLDKDKRFFHPHIVKCSVCNNSLDMYGVNAGRGDANFCPNCGADMRTPVETARDIVHEAIDNSVWSDTVDTAKMHKVVDDKYVEIRGDANVDANT